MTSDETTIQAITDANGEISTNTELVEPKVNSEPKTKKRRTSVLLSPDSEKLMRLMITELGYEEKGMTASERTSALFELAMSVLEAEMEMARISTNQRFISEAILKDYIARKYESDVKNVRPAPLFY